MQTSKAVERVKKERVVAVNGVNSNRFYNNSTQKSMYFSYKFLDKYPPGLYNYQR